MPAYDPFSTHAESVTAPISNAVAVSPSDSADLSHVSRMVQIGGDGDLSVVMRAGQSVTFRGLTAGQVLPIRVTRVLATGTTATDIVACW